MKLWRQEQRIEQNLQHIDLPSSINDRIQSLGAEVRAYRTYDRA